MRMDVEGKFLPKREKALVLLGLTPAHKSREFRECKCQDQNPLAITMHYLKVVMESSLISGPAMPFNPWMAILQHGMVVILPIVAKKLLKHRCQNQLSPPPPLLSSSHTKQLGVSKNNKS